MPLPNQMYSMGLNFLMHVYVLSLKKLFISCLPYARHCVSCWTFRDEQGRGASPVTLLSTQPGSEDQT